MSWSWQFLLPTANEFLIIVTEQVQLNSTIRVCLFIFNSWFWSDAAFASNIASPLFVSTLLMGEFGFSAFSHLCSQGCQSPRIYLDCQASMTWPIFMATLKEAEANGSERDKTCAKISASISLIAVICADIVHRLCRLISQTKSIGIRSSNNVL